MGWRIYGYAVAALVLVAVSVPFTWPASRDSFPLSNYPMFSRPRPTPAVTVHYSLGIEPGGARRHLAPELVANDEVLQARAVLARAVRGGAGAAAEVCRAIARRVARAGGELARVSEVRIVTGSHDAVAYLTGRNATGVERVHVTCAVGGAGQDPGDDRPARSQRR